MGGFLPACWPQPSSLQRSEAAWGRQAARRGVYQNQARRSPDRSTQPAPDQPPDRADMAQPASSSYRQAGGQGMQGMGAQAI